MHIDCNAKASNKIICETIDCSSFATEEIKVSAGKVVISLHVCNNCIKLFEGEAKPN
jgi:hypothetical protein